MRNKCFCYVAAAAGLLLSVGRAHADPVAPLVPKLEPAKAAELIVRFHDALGKGLQAGGLSIVAPATVRKKLKLPAENAGCATGSCLTTAMSAFGSRQRLATAEIKSVGKNYTITVRLFRGSRELGHASGRCDICTLSEALKATTRIATDVGAKGEEPPDLASPPPKKPTPHAVHSEKTPKETTPKGAINDASKANTTPTKTDTPPPAGQAQEGRRWPLWPALASAGVGVLGLAIGIPVLSMDGEYTNCIGAPQPGGRNCADRYNTKGGGWIAAGMGIVGLAASGVLFYLYFKSNRTTSGSTTKAELRSFGFAPTAGGAIFGATGRF